MSFCQTCGTSLPDGSLACPACGAHQGVAASSAASSPPPGATPGYVPGPTPGSYPGPTPAPLPAAAGLTPNVAEAHIYLGYALDANGQYDAAIAEFKEANRLNSDSLVVP